MRILKLILLIFLLTACRTTKKIEKSASGDLLETIDSRLRSNLGVDYSMDRVKIDIRGNRKLNLNAKVYISYDKFIFLSFNYIGFEVARALMTKDSVFFINRAERTYFKKSVREIKNKYFSSLSLEFMQRFLINGYAIPEGIKAKRIVNYFVRVDNNEYLFMPGLSQEKNLKMVYNEDVKLINFNYIDNKGNLFLNVDLDYNHLNQPDKLIAEFISIKEKYNIILVPGKIENKSIKIPEFTINKGYNEIKF